MRRVDWVVVTIVLLFTAGLRIIGISYGQLNSDYFPSTAPYRMLHEQVPIQPDEYTGVAIPVNMALYNRLNPNFYEYPTFIVNTNFVLYHLTGALDGLSLDDRRGKNLRVYAEFPLYVFSRMFSVYGGLLMVACAYAISRLVAGRYVALCAGLLTAVSFTLVQHAHYIKPGTLSAGWMMLVTWACVASLYSKNMRYREWLYIVGGISTGLAATTRYNAAAVGLIVLLVGLILLYRYRTQRMMLAIFLSWIAIPIVFLFGSPYVLLDFENFWKGFTYIVGQFTVTGANVQNYFLVDSWTGFGYVLMYLLLFAIGIPAIVYMGLGFIGAWQDRPRQTNLLKQNSQLLYVSIIGIFVGVYALVILRTIRPGHSDNLLILVLPYIALLASVGAGWLVQIIPLPTSFTMPTVLLILILQPLILSVQVVEMFSQQDTRHVMLDWIHNNIPHNARFFLNGPYNVPLDNVLYPNEQQFGVYVPTLPEGDNYDYMIYSDALAYDVLRSESLVPADIRIRQIDYLAELDRRFSRIAEIHRPIWTGSEAMMNMATYWHNPTLILYCLNPDSCEEIGRN
jgi:hypothetical protein